MTTTTETTELDEQTAPASPDAPDLEQQDEPTTEQDATDEQDATERPGNREARYRKQLRTVEAERDNLTEQLEAARRGLVDHLAQTQGRIRPEALWASGVTVADLLDDAGGIDPAKVAAACDDAAGMLGLTRTPRPDRNQGSRANDGAPPVTEQFAAAFKPRRD